MKRKDFVFNLCFLLFLNLLVKPFWILGIDVEVQNQVGAEAYGLYFAIFNFTFMFNILLDMGITNFNNRNIAQNRQLLDKHLSGIIGLRCLLGVIYLAVVFLVALLIGYRGTMLKLLFWTGINQFLNTFLLYLRSNVSALMMFKTDSVLSVLDRLLMILLCGILLWGNITTQPFHIEWFVYSQTIAYLTTIIVALAIVIHKSHLRRLHWSRPFNLMILKKSLPFATLTLLMSFYYRIDSVMIERLLPSNISAMQAGIYASAFRLLDALVMISYLFSVILLPLFSKMIKAKEDLTTVIKPSVSLLYLMSVSAVAILFCFRDPVMSWLYTEHVSASAAVFAILIPCFIPMSFTYIFGTLLTANGSMKRLNITAAIGIAVNFSLNLILIPKLQARGAAIASISTQCTVSLLQFFIALKELNIPIRSLPLTRCLLFTTLFIPAIILFATKTAFPLIPNLCIALGIAIILGFLSGLLSLKEMMGLGRRGEEKLRY